MGKADHVVRERDILFKVKDHPNIVTINHTLVDENHVYFDQEYLPNGSLHQLIDRFKKLPGINGLGKKLSKVYLAQMVNAIQFLQIKKVVHRDLKPLNVMLDEFYNVKIIDFGDAKEFKDEHEN